MGSDRGMNEALSSPPAPEPPQSLKNGWHRHRGREGGRGIRWIRVGFPWKKPREAFGISRERGDSRSPADPAAAPPAPA